MVPGAYTGGDWVRRGLIWDPDAEKILKENTEEPTNCEGEMLMEKVCWEHCRDDKARKESVPTNGPKEELP